MNDPKPLYRLVSEVMLDATPKLEAEGVGGILIIIRQYPDGYLDVATSNTTITIPPDKLREVFSIATTQALVASVREAHRAALANKTGGKA